MKTKSQTLAEPPYWRTTQLHPPWRSLTLVPWRAARLFLKGVDLASNILNAEIVRNVGPGLPPERIEPATRQTQMSPWHI